MHSLLVSLHHLESRGERLDEPVATWYYTQILATRLRLKSKNSQLSRIFPQEVLEVIFPRFSGLPNISAELSGK